MYYFGPYLPNSGKKGFIFGPIVKHVVPHLKSKQNLTFLFHFIWPYTIEGELKNTLFCTSA
jgi:hypothetical protein